MNESAYSWQPVSVTDLSALDALDAACTKVDGPQSVPSPTYPALLAEPATVMLCASANDAPHPIVAVGWVQIDGSQAKIGGKVHPDHRRRKLGSHILDWAEAQANDATTFVIRHEAFNAGSAALYAQYGYQCDFVQAWMMRDLHKALPTVTQAFTHIPWNTDNAP